MQDVIFSIRIKKILKNVATVVVLGVFIFGFACTGGHHNTIMSKLETSANVSILSINGDQPCCLTSISHSFDLWKNVLVLIPGKIGEGFMLLVLSFVLSIIFNWFAFKHYKFDRFVLILRLYLKKIFDFKLFNRLNLAFTQGILNPKTY